MSLRRTARFVESACADWQIDLILDDAVVVACELVANAVQHAGTAGRLAPRYWAGGPTIVVYDQNPELTLPLRSVADRGRGCDLVVVAALRSDWVSRGQDEKCVWAFLPLSAGSAYSHTVRTVARDTVRIVLAHSGDFRDAAEEVRRLITWLTAQHGRDLVRDIADELAKELDEASDVAATQDAPDPQAVDST